MHRGRRNGLRLARVVAISGWCSAVAAMCLALTPAAGASATGQPAGYAKAVGFAKAEVAYYAKNLPPGLRSPGHRVDTECFSAADDHVSPEMNSNGAPANPAWYQRDALNQYCATLRLRDQYTNPAYGYENAVQGDALWIRQLGEQISDGPGHIHGGLTTLIPGSQAADSFRTVNEWEHRTGGHAIEVAFPASDGAQLRGYIWLPPPGTPALPNGKHPGVVITDGSVQGYQNLYFWAAEGLAQYGYEVMTYDVQGQGDSDLLPGHCRPSASALRSGSVCTGVPYQQNYNFFQGAEDALNYFLSAPSHPYTSPAVPGESYNPGWPVLDSGDVGIAGHSLGAQAVSWAGQCDRRVRAIVAWDDLAPVTMSRCARNVTVPAADRATQIHAPALAMTNDYEFNPGPQTKVPNPNGSGGLGGGGINGTAGYLSLSRGNSTTSNAADTQIVSIRNGTHLTYSYVPYMLPANEIGERIAFYYTLAWFDEYLRVMPFGQQDPLLPRSDTAFRRLTDTAGTYDRSPDDNGNKANPPAARISFGAGTYSPGQAAADPANPAAGNVPYQIKGIPVAGTLSFYYYSEYSLHDPATGRLAVCTDMLYAGTHRGRCPATQPPAP